MSDAATPLEKLGVLAHQSVDVAPGLAHHELFTMGGLLTVLWHGEPTSPGVVVACGGAMGGLLGPSGGLYHDLGNALAAQGIQTLRIAYRQPNDLSRCVHDAVAEMMRFVDNSPEPSLERLAAERRAEARRQGLR